MEVNIYIGFGTLKVKWPSRMQGQWFLWNQVGGQQFSVVYKKSHFSSWAAAPAQIPPPPEKFEGGGDLTSSQGQPPSHQDHPQVRAKLH
jgi:hypothetical protein